MLPLDLTNFCPGGKREQASDKLFSLHWQGCRQPTQALDNELSLALPDAFLFYSCRVLRSRSNINTSQYLDHSTDSSPRCRGLRKRDTFCRYSSHDQLSLLGVVSLSLVTVNGPHH